MSQHRQVCGSRSIDELFDQAQRYHQAGELAAAETEHEDPIIIGMMVRTLPAAAIAGPVECIDGGPLLCGKRDVQWLLELAFASDPEIGLAGAPESRLSQNLVGGLAHVLLRA
jgi:hypothetical protein